MFVLCKFRQCEGVFLAISLKLKPRNYPISVAIAVISKQVSILFDFCKIGIKVLKFWYHDNPSNDTKKYNNFPLSGLHMARGENNTKKKYSSL